MSDSHAEQLDPSVLGEEVGDDGRPGDAFPPDEPLAVDDPNITADGSIAPDDVETREDRLVDDAARATPADGDDTTTLVDPEAADVPSLDDTERQLVADEATDGDGPEAAAVHVVDADRPG